MRLMGLDLAQASDYSCAVVLERDDSLPPVHEPDAGRGTLRCVSLKRWERGTSYEDVADDVVGLGWHYCVPDFCGVGRPVVNALQRRMRERRHKGKLFPVMTVGSQVGVVREHKDARDQPYATVPKVDLVSSIQIVKQRKLLALPGHPLVPVLLAELDDYQMRISKAANQQFGNSPERGKNDDLVSALGLAVWGFLWVARRRPAIWLASQAEDYDSRVVTQSGTDAAGPGAVVTPRGCTPPGESKWRPAAEVVTDADAATEALAHDGVERDALDRFLAGVAREANDR